MKPLCKLLARGRYLVYIKAMNGKSIMSISWFFFSKQLTEKEKIKKIKKIRFS